MVMGNSAAPLAAVCLRVGFQSEECLPGMADIPFPLILGRPGLLGTVSVSCSIRSSNCCEELKPELMRPSALSFASCCHQVLKLLVIQHASAAWRR